MIVPPPKVILCATDFSEPSRLALSEAITLAKTYGLSTLRLLSVGPPIERLVVDGTVAPSLEAEIVKMEEAEAIEVRKLADSASQSSGLTVVGEYRVGHPADEIVRHAQEVGADLLVVGTHGRTGFKRLFLGSVAEQVLRRAPCTVVAVREKKAAE